MSPNRYVLLDRDGTLIVDRGYLDDPDQVELISGVGRALREFRGLGYGLIVLTNQSGVGRGYITEGELEGVHDRLNGLLAEEGIVVDDIYVCPHHPDDSCSCRKPRPGLVEQAAREHGFDPRDCLVIGDKACDVALGRAVGATTLLVRTGSGRVTERHLVTPADLSADSLLDAVRLWRNSLRHPYSHSTDRTTACPP
jgi:D-glycero-D-manno-heptose 1,7-bisphosphate phosphatase